MRYIVRWFMQSGLAQLAVQILGLWLLALIAQALVAQLPVPIPSGALGLAILFALLLTGIVPLRSIERGASVLVRHHGLFLTPYAVSIIAFSELLLASGLGLAIALIASTAIGMAATGWAAQSTAQSLHRRRDPVEGAKQ